MNRPTAWGLLAAGVLGACALQGSPGPSAGAGSSPSPAPITAGVTADYPARLTGHVSAPSEATAGAGSRYRAQTSAARRVKGALVYLMTPDERLYLDKAGKAVMTTTDADGNYDLPASVNQPLVVTALLPSNQRLVGYTLLSAPGTYSLDVSLASTYVAEFLRDRAQRAGKSLADFDLARVEQITGITTTAIVEGTLAATADISQGAIPDLVSDYLVTLASKSRPLSDAWADLVGGRPHAVTRLDDLSLPGYQASAIAVRGSDVYVASFNDTGARVQKSGAPGPLFGGLASAGLIRIDGMTFSPAGDLYFVQSEDRYLGGAVDRTAASPSIRLFVYFPEQLSVEERRLVLPQEIAPYLADRAGPTQIEPFDLGWHADRLYVGDYQTSLIYAFEATGSFFWPGEVFAGRVEDGKPVRGKRGGTRREASFGLVTHLLWQGEDLLVTDSENSVLRRIRPDGTVEVVAGVIGQRGLAGDEGPPTDALLDYPKGTVFDASGRLFLADGDNKRIRVIEGGRIRTIAGGGTRTAGRGDPRDVAFGMLTDMAFDADGNLLFVDWASGKVWRLWLQFGL